MAANATIATRTRADLAHPGVRVARDAHPADSLERAVEAYRFSYPTVSAEAFFEGTREIGIEDGKALALLDAKPRHVVFTANSDTLYAGACLDLHAMGPVVIEPPAGAFVGVVDDPHPRWVLDFGPAGPDGGRGGSYVVLPPGFTGTRPDGFFAARGPTRFAFLGVRALPSPGAAARDAMRAIRVFPLRAPTEVLETVDVTESPFDATPLRWEENIAFWNVLHGILDSEPVIDEFRPMYGELAALGLVKGERFSPSPSRVALLERAAREGLARMRAEAFASDRPERLAVSRFALRKVFDKSWRPSEVDPLDA